MVVAARFQLGDWTVDPSSNSLSKEDTNIRLEPKVMLVLLCLVRKHGEVVPRDVLVRSAWPDTFVSDDVLKRAISELRKALGDDARQPRYVETISKGGYRLLCEVGPIPPEPASAPVLPIDSPRPKRASLWAPRAAAVAILFGSVLFMYSSRRSSSMPHVPVAIAASLGEERNPRLSPDGERLAYAWRQAGQPKFDLYVKSLKSGSIVKLTGEQAEWIYPAWSPDGKVVVFARAGRQGCGLYKIAAGGGAEEKILDVEPADASPLVGIMQVDVSADGAYIAYSGSPTRPRTPPQVFLVDTRSNSVWRMSPPSDWCYAPRFSADSTRLLFSCAPSEGISEIHVSELPRGGSRVVVRDNSRFTHATWADSDSHIIYSNAEGLWRVPAKGGEAVKILAASGVSNPQFVQSSGRILYESSSISSKIVSLSFGEGTRNEFVSTGVFDNQPTYSPDGTHIAFTSLRSGTQEIWIRNADGSGLRQLTTLGASTTGTPRWSHDGKEIVFDSRAHGAPGIYVADLDGRVVRRVATAGLEASLPSFSADDASIYFSSPAALPEAWRVSVQGGVPTRLTQGGGFAPVESPDGRTVYFLRNEGELWKIPVRGGTARRVELTCGVRGGFGWTLNGEGIYYLSAAAPNRLRFYDFESHRDRDVGTVNADWGGFSVTTDGKHVVYTQMDGEEADIYTTE